MFLEVSCVFFAVVVSFPLLGLSLGCFLVCFCCGWGWCGGFFSCFLFSVLLCSGFVSGGCLLFGLFLAVVASIKLPLKKKNFCSFKKKKRPVSAL